MLLITNNLTDSYGELVLELLHSALENQPSHSSSCIKNQRSRYIKNTFACGTTPKEHLLNTGRTPQTSKKAN